MTKTINYILVFLFFGLIGFGIYKYKKPPIPENIPTYIFGKKDTVTIKGKPDTVTVTKKIYVEKKILPNAKGGDITPGVAALTPIVDTLIVQKDDSLYLRISSYPVPDSLFYSIHWIGKERIIKQVDTIMITQVDTIKIPVPSSSSFWKGAAVGATFVVTTGAILWSVLK